MWGQLPLFGYMIICVGIAMVLGLIVILPILSLIASTSIPDRFGDVVIWVSLGSLVVVWFFLPVMVGPDFSVKRYVSEYPILGIQLEKTYKLEQWAPGNNPVSTSHPEDIRFYVDDLCSPQVQAIPLLVSGGGQQRLVTVPVDMVFSQDAQEATITINSLELSALERGFTFTPANTKVAWSWGNLAWVRQGTGVVVQQRHEDAISAGELFQSMSPTVTVVAPFCED